MPVSDMKAYMKNRYRQKMDEFINLKGGKCVECGSINRLNFHHVDQSNKKFVISKKWSAKDILDELDKCVLLCEKCHKRKHFNAKGKHGTLSSYRYCKCNLCRAAVNKYNKEYKKNKRASIAQVDRATSL